MCWLHMPTGRKAEWRKLLGLFAILDLVLLHVKWSQHGIVEAWALLQLNVKLTPDESDDALQSRKDHIALSF